MTQPQDFQLELAKNILRKGKALAPDRFPQPNIETAREWADALRGMSFPVEVWPEAVLLWATELVGERMATPRELKRAAKLVVERWESNPVRREQLRAHREAEVAKRDRQIADGSFAAVRGYQPKALGEAAPVDLDRIQELVRGAGLGLRQVDR